MYLAFHMIRRSAWQEQICIVVIPANARTCRNLAGTGSSFVEDACTVTSAHFATTAVPWIVFAMKVSMFGRPKFKDTGCFPRERFPLDW